MKEAFYVNSCIQIEYLLAFLDTHLNFIEDCLGKIFSKSVIFVHFISHSAIYICINVCMKRPLCEIHVVNMRFCWHIWIRF